MILLNTSNFIDFIKREDPASIIPDDEKPVVTVISSYEIMAYH
jgi:hypothetical protein